MHRYLELGFHADNNDRHKLIALSLVHARGVIIIIANFCMGGGVLMHKTKLHVPTLYVGT